MAVIPAIPVSPHGQHDKNVSVITWGVPTNVATPGGQSNTPKPADASVEPTATPIVAGSTFGNVSGVAGPTYVGSTNDRCIQVTGIAGGATVSVMGSNDGLNPVILTDTLGVALGAVAPGSIYQIRESVGWLHLALSGVPSGTTSMAVILRMRTKF